MVTDGDTDGHTDGPTDRLIEMRGRIYKDTVFNDIPENIAKLIALKNRAEPTISFAQVVMTSSPKEFIQNSCKETRCCCFFFFFKYSGPP